MEETKAKSEFQLQLWQKAVIECIDGHERRMDSEEYMSMEDFQRNDMAKIRVQFPLHSGHTTLSAYIFDHYDTTLLYYNMQHYNDIQKRREMWTERNENSEFVSIFEVNYGNTNRDTRMLDRDALKRSIKDKKVIVVDRASAMLPGVEEFLLCNASGAIVLLD